MKIFFFCLLLAVYSARVSAQTNELNKNKVSEYFQNEQYKEAISYLTPYLGIGVQDVFILNSLGYAYLMNEQTSEAEVFYKKANDIDSANFTSNKYLAHIEKERENFNQALVYYDRMLKEQPQNASIYKSAGDLYLLLKMDDTALYYYAQAYKLQPFNIKYVSGYTSRLLNVKNYRTADSILNIFLAIDSTNVPAMILAVRSSYEQTNYWLTSSFSNRWINIKPDEINVSTTIRLALANYELKNYFLSYKVCDTVIKQEIIDERILYHAARALNKLGQHKESNDLLEQCLDMAISKDAEKYFFERAENFESLKQYKAAITASDTAFYLFKNPLALYNMGRLYETGLKNKPKSIQYYKQYLKKASPTSADEKKVYAYLKELLQENKAKQ